MISEEAENLINERLAELPEMQEIISRPDFRIRLEDIAEYSGLARDYANMLELEVILVLALYAPVSELAANIAASAKISTETAEQIATLVHSTLLQPVYEELVGYEALSTAQQAPQVSAVYPAAANTATNPPEPSTPTPLTRDDILKALNASRTMGSDTASLQKKESQ